jgi:hypothetical protein
MKGFIMKKKIYLILVRANNLLSTNMNKIISRKNPSFLLQIRSPLPLFLYFFLKMSLNIIRMPYILIISLSIKCLHLPCFNTFFEIKQNKNKGL